MLKPATIEIPFLH